MHEAGISEKSDGELSIETSIHATSEDLMNQVIDNTMKEVIPWKFKEQILQQVSSPQETLS